MIKTFDWFERPAVGKHQPTPVHDAILKTRESLQCIFPVCHIQVNDIRVVYKKHSSQSAVHQWQWANKFGTESFPLVCIENGDTNNGPTGQSCLISLAKSLCFYIDYLTRWFFWVTKYHGKEEFHYLNWLQHGTLCLLENTKGAKHQEGNCMRYTIVAVICIHQTITSHQ